MTEMLRSRFVHPWCEERPASLTDPPSELIDAGELARRLGIARSTVWWKRVHADSMPRAG